MKSRQAGFTLVELIIVVALMSFLIAMAAPSFRSMLVRRSVSSAADALVTDMKFARSEAIRRTTTVSMCSSSNGTSCLTSAASWKSGWLIWVDDKVGGTVGTLDADEQIVRVQSALPTIASIGDDPSNDRLLFTFLPLGLARAASQTFVISPVGGGSAADGSVRVVCVSNQGRVALRAVGTSAC